MRSCAQSGMLAIGVVKPDRTMAGDRNRKTPRIACCWVLATDEITSPMPTADRTKATVMVKVKFNTLDGRILPEMSAKVAFLSREVTEGEKRPRTAVNRGAVVERDGRKYVFLVRQGRAVIAPVTTSDPFGDMVEIKSGAASGDKVVLDPPGRLKNGSRVKIREQ